jgi:hypothetical protein
MAPLTPKELLIYLLEDNELMPDQLDEFIRANPEEGQYVDYKNGIITTRQKRDEGRQTIREYTSGFANSDGGVLIIGVDESRPRQIVPCAQNVGAQPLDQWAMRCLHDMVAYFSPQPRFQVVQHPQGHVLTIAAARAPTLVPCVESKELKYFFRIGDSTVPVPEYLIADLVLGRRQHPLLDLSPLPINEGRQELKSRDGQDNIPARSAAFSFRVENLSLATAEDVQIGVVSWSLFEGATEEINRHLRSYLDICDINIQSSMSTHFHLVHRSSISSGKKFYLDPFQKLTIGNIGPFYFPQQFSAQVLGAVYIIAKGAPPIWFQLEFGCLTGGIPTRLVSEHFRPTLIRKGTERSQIAWVTE